MSLIVDEHREYLADRARVGAYERALQSIVRPGDIGLDLASGTGILGLLACRAGAARVYAVESGDIAGLAERLAADNGLQHRIVIINEHSSRAVLPERVDFIVTDLAGRFGFEAGLFEVLRDAKARFLKPGGTLMPRRVTMFVAPVESADVREHVDFWSERHYGWQFEAAHAIARATGSPRHFSPPDLLATGKQITGADLMEDTTTLAGRASFVLTRSGSLDGLAGWFSAELAPGVDLTNAPGRADRINRRNVFFPLHDRVTANAGDVVDVTMVIRPESLVVRWRVEVKRGADVRHVTDTSTFSGMLISKANVDRTRPDFTPTLTEAGLARRTVVDLCDGTRSVRDIEREVFNRHRALFKDSGEAAAFVAEVVTRYAV